MGIYVKTCVGKALPHVSGHGHARVLVQDRVGCRAVGAKVIVVVVVVVVVVVLLYI